MKLCDIEKQLRIAFPLRHKKAMADDTDPVHEACDFLVPTSQYKGLLLLNVNDFLHDPQTMNRWPDFLIAFASNGCGDYFAYDTRTEPAKIIYMDPDKTVAANLEKTDGFEFDTFEGWYEMKVGQRRT